MRKYRRYHCVMAQNLIAKSSEEAPVGEYIQRERFES